MKTSLSAAFSSSKDRGHDVLRPDCVVDYRVQKFRHFDDQFRSRFFVVMDEPFMHGVISNKANSVRSLDNVRRNAEFGNHFHKLSSESFFFAETFKTQSKKSGCCGWRNERYPLSFRKRNFDGLRHVIGWPDWKRLRPNKFFVIPNRRLSASVADPNLKILRIEKLEEVFRLCADSFESRIGIDFHLALVSQRNSMPLEMTIAPTVRACTAV